MPHVLRIVLLGPSRVHTQLRSKIMHCRINSIALDAVVVTPNAQNLLSIPTASNNYYCQPQTLCTVWAPHMQYFTRYSATMQGLVVFNTETDANSFEMTTNPGA